MKIASNFMINFNFFISIAEGEIEVLMKLFELFGFAV